MNIKSKEDVFNFISKLTKQLMEDPAAMALIPKDRGVNVCTVIEDIDLTYSERIGFGKYEFLEGRADDTEITLKTDTLTHYKIQVGEFNPMACVANKSLRIDGVPFKLLKGQKFNNEFKRQYAELIKNESVEGVE